ncbi:macrophage mannose receptor 1-like isoform X1 [Oreochromis niloticus]|uniref:macrophage mannose receptor 1-like isoform X1 n=1 Tax=Oreochromis niloticus TaxID=8128 RepID=UPI000DF42777|nr:macrophage mannose receptor 1-like isoform X1 [Oreochromis niloticus]
MKWYKSVYKISMNLITSVPSMFSQMGYEDEKSFHNSRTKGESREHTRMEKALFIIAASGLCAVASDVKHYYQFVYELKNWTEALSYCRDKYTDLATVEDFKDVQMLNSTVDLSKMTTMEYGNRAWIGLYDDVNSWRWPMSENSEAEFRNWSPGQPDNRWINEYCVRMLDGLWFDSPCVNVYRFVCSDNRGSTRTFVYINNPMSWANAQSYCRVHYTDLASVMNMTENQKIDNLVPTGLIVWIGLFRESWKWTDGSKPSYIYWKTNEPNNKIGAESCVAANFEDNAKWEDWNCDSKKEFVCNVAPVYKEVVRVNLINSALDLTQPDVMEAMLNQIQQTLKEQGVKGDVKLSWRKQSDGSVFYKDEETKKSIV